MKKSITIKQENDKPVPVEIMAQSILDISNAMKQLGNSRLKRDVITTLIARKSGLKYSVIELVLNNLEALERNWLK